MTLLDITIQGKAAGTKENRTRVRVYTHTRDQHAVTFSISIPELTNKCDEVLEGSLPGGLRFQ